MKKVFVLLTIGGLFSFHVSYGYFWHITNGGGKDLEVTLNVSGQKMTKKLSENAYSEIFDFGTAYGGPKTKGREGLCLTSISADGKKLNYYSLQKDGNLKRSPLPNKCWVESFIIMHGGPGSYLKIQDPYFLITNRDLNKLYENYYHSEHLRKSVEKINKSIQERQKQQEQKK